MIWSLSAHVLSLGFPFFILLKVSELLHPTMIIYYPIDKTHGLTGRSWWARPVPPGLLLNSFNFPRALVMDDHGSWTKILRSRASSWSNQRTEYLELNYVIHWASKRKLWTQEQECPKNPFYQWLISGLASQKVGKLHVVVQTAVARLFFLRSCTDVGTPHPIRGLLHATNCNASSCWRWSWWLLACIFPIIHIIPTYIGTVCIRLKERKKFEGKKKKRGHANRQSTREGTYLAT